MEDNVMQLLILKILFLLFTTKGTSEYFYTNDLCVLVDVFLREILDLDEQNESVCFNYSLNERTRLSTDFFFRIIKKVTTYIFTRSPPTPHTNSTPFNTIQTTTNSTYARIARCEICVSGSESDDETVGGTMFHRGVVCVVETATEGGE